MAKQDIIIVGLHKKIAYIDYRGTKSEEYVLNAAQQGFKYGVAGQLEDITEVSTLLRIY